MWPDLGKPGKKNWDSYMRRKFILLPKEWYIVANFSKLFKVRCAEGSWRQVWSLVHVAHKFKPLPPTSQVIYTPGARNILLAWDNLLTFAVHTGNSFSQSLLHTVLYVAAPLKPMKETFLWQEPNHFLIHHHQLHWMTSVAQNLQLHYSPSHSSLGWVLASSLQ